MLVKNAYIVYKAAREIGGSEWVRKVMFIMLEAYLDHDNSNQSWVCLEDILNHCLKHALHDALHLKDEVLGRASKSRKHNCSQPTTVCMDLTLDAYALPNACPCNLEYLICTAVAWTCA